MAPTVPQQHPAVVLRSHYTLLRALLIVATAAVVCLAIAVAVLAIDDNATTQPAETPAAVTSTPGTGVAGHPEEGLADRLAVPQATGHPEEGLAGH